MMLDISSPQECFPTDPNNPNQSRLELNLVSYTCGYTDIPLNENRTKFRRTGAYSESATLFFGTGEQAVYHLFSKHTHKQFSYAAMSTMLVIYFFMGCWSAGTSISSGLVVPMLLIGGLYGRMVGCLFVDKFGIQTNKYWKWLDPGAFALLGKFLIHLKRSEGGRRLTERSVFKFFFALGFPNKEFNCRFAPSVLRTSLWT